MVAPREVDMEKRVRGSDQIHCESNHEPVPIQNDALLD